MAKRKWLRRTLGLGLLAGAAYAVWRAIEANRAPGDAEWEPQPFPFPPQPKAGQRAPTTSSPTMSARDGWVEPDAGACPATHPVKAKASSRIFHVPGGLNYDRTVADRCYVDASSAEADGFRQSKR